MKKIVKHINKQRALVILLMFSTLLLTMCITIVSVNQPSSATVGENINIGIDVSLNPSTADTQYLVFGFLAPESWDVENNANVTFTTTVGSGSMSIISDEELAPNSAGGLNWEDEITAVFGKGGNYGQVKWIVYKSDVALSAANGVEITGQILVNLTVGQENLITQLGYVVANTGYGVSGSDHDSIFTDCMEVTGGTNPTNNLCGADPNLVTFSPESYTLEDVITMNFDASKGDATLLNATQVYLCVSAMVDGALVEACENSAALTMTDKGNGVWSITIWPRNLLNVAVDSDIADFKYSFKNEAGDVIVQNPNTSQGFVLEENCN